MGVIAQRHHVPLEDYLRFEADGPVRHEYIGGTLYAMAGSSEQHHLISMNVANACFNHLRGGPCKTYMADFKVRLRINDEDVFYYPDVMVACGREGVEKYYLRHPKLIVEILSESTEGTDRREKLLSYQQIASLDEYVLVAQDRYEVTLHRRADAWRPLVLTSPTDTIELRSISLSISVAGIYEGVL